VSHHLLTGHVTVALPPAEAFRLFTPLGEREWVPGWNPRFPVATADDSAPGTVFETPGTTWVVVDRTPGRHVRYARIARAATAGTVTVDLADAGGHSDVTVTYELTALTDAAAPDLDAFATGYPDMLRAWQAAIAAFVDLGRPLPS
jgi:hypothetical protein